MAGPCQDTSALLFYIFIIFFSPSLLLSLLFPSLKVLFVFWFWFFFHYIALCLKSIKHNGPSLCNSCTQQPWEFVTQPQNKG